ncbi:hypothetical protein [Stappia indica]|uniref:hypothetical protein n=1 Tax=Stappia indica TaxID=538381 RepID=UPI0011121A70|nr:hypothetical protein [Stappia indica]
MEDDDYLELIEYLKANLVEAGLSEYAADEVYYEIDLETGEARLPPPREHLLGILDAFTRVLKRRDRGFLDSCLSRISQLVEGDGPAGALIEFPRRVDFFDDTPDIVDLAGTPDFSNAIEETRELRIQIAELPNPRHK